jgi:predicted permease
LAVVLLVASGLMIRTFQAMRNVDPGFSQPAEVLTFRVSVPDTLIADPVQTAQIYEQIATRLEQIPGIASVGLASSITMDGNTSNDPIFVEGMPESDKLPPIRRIKAVGQNYFRTVQTRLVAGKEITWADIHARTPIALVSENFAREYWKEPSAALGKRIRESPTDPWRSIVGVVADARDDGVVRPAPAIIYWPLVLDNFGSDKIVVFRNMAFAIRTPRLNSPTLLKEVQQAVWSVNGNLPVARVRTLEEIQSDSMAQTSFALVMLSIAASVALVLGIVGIYGVISYIATQRTREIGIRIALGAARGDVSRLFLRHGFLLAVVGIAIGIVAAAFVTRVMATLLFGVSSIDALTYASVALGLGGTALLASYLPAVRAARINPAEALRWEA